jgi:uncharacterized protein YqhQ
MDALIAVNILFAMVVFYLLPGIIAEQRGHPKARQIVAVNILLGWMGMFWIIALLWALSGPRFPKKVRGI